MSLKVVQRSEQFILLVESSEGGGMNTVSASCGNPVIPALAKGAADQRREPRQLLPPAGVGPTCTSRLLGT